MNLRRELGDRWTHLCSGWYQWLIQMVGKQRVLVDNVKEGEAGGALRSGKRVKSLWLECTAALRHIHTHTHTRKQTNAKKHIITQLSMVMGLHRSFWKCSETLQICVTQHGKSATSCLSPHPPLSLFFFQISVSCPAYFSLHRLTCNSVSLFSSHTF